MIQNNASTEAPDRVHQSIALMRPKYPQANRFVTMKPLVSEHPDDAGIELPFVHKDVEIESWVKMLTAALLWGVTGSHDSGTDWGEAHVFSPSYIPGRCSAELTAEELVSGYDRNIYEWRNLEDTGVWRHGWQPDSGPFPPDIYNFDVCLDRVAGSPAAIFKHYFFSKHPYYVSFGTSERVLSAMNEYLAAEADRLRDAGIAFRRALLPPPRYQKARSKNGNASRRN
jgi:hypothetical protein